MTNNTAHDTLYNIINNIWKQQSFYKRNRKTFIHARDTRARLDQKESERDSFRAMRIRTIQSPELRGRWMTNATMIPPNETLTVRSTSNEIS